MARWNPVVALKIVNGINLILGIVLLSFGGAGTGLAPPRFQWAAISVLIAGVTVFTMALLGYYAATKEKQRVIMAYVAMLISLMFFMLFAGLYMITFVSDAEEMEKRVVRSWDSIQGMVPPHVTKQVYTEALLNNLQSMGIVCFLIFLNMVVAIKAALDLTDMRIMLKILLKTLDTIALLASLALVMVGVVAIQSGYGGTWTAVTVVVLGSFVAINSVVGYQGASRESRAILLCHFATLLLVTVLLLIFGVVGFLFLPQLESFIQDNWQRIRQELPNPRMTQAEVQDIAASNIKAMFLFVITVVLLLLVKLGATLQLRRHIKLKPPEDPEVLAEEARQREIKAKSLWVPIFPQKTKIPLPILQDTLRFGCVVAVLRLVKTLILYNSDGWWIAPYSVKDTWLAPVEALTALIILGRFLYVGDFDVRVTLSLRPFKLRLLLLTLVMTLVLDLLMHAVLWNTNQEDFRRNIHHWIRQTDFLAPSFWVPFWYFTQLLSVFTQQLIFFGVIMRGFSSRLRRLGSMLVVSSLYAVWQLETIDSLFHFFLGLYLSWMVIRSGSIWLPVLNMLFTVAFNNTVKCLMQAWPSFWPHISNEERYEFFINPVWVPLLAVLFVVLLFLFERVTKRKMAKIQKAR